MDVARVTADEAGAVCCGAVRGFPPRSAAHRPFVAIRRAGPFGPSARKEGPFGPSARTRTLIYETWVAHNGLIPPFSAVACCVIPVLVCGTGGGAPPVGLAACPGGVPRRPPRRRGQFEKSVVSKE